MSFEVPLDKRAHFLGGWALCVTVGLWFTPIIGFAAGSLANVLKDLVWDLAMKKGDPDVKDVIAGVAGAAVGAAFLAAKTWG